MMKKLPYIPDKGLYAAVMFACQMIRENGYFHKDCDIAARYYDVDAEEVEKYVRIAQGRGQKEANSKNPRKYKWYVVTYRDCYYGYYDDWEYDGPDSQTYHYAVTRAVSGSNAESQFRTSFEYEQRNRQGHFVESVSEYSSKSEAEAARIKLIRHNHPNLRIGEKDIVTEDGNTITIHLGVI